MYTIHPLLKISIKKTWIWIFNSILFYIQLKWQPPPICFLPESLRGYGITDLDSTKIDQCIELIIDEDHDAASTSHNFLDQGNMEILIIF